ncbi:MFS transporter [Candidatus Parcubacteria bacterium]|nr:MFS transporter [Candidatus Parcubacteria bacterium]
MFKLKYFNNNLSSGFVALFSGRMIQFAAQGLIGLFLPIFLLTKLNYRIEYVFFYYIIGYLSYALLLPIGAQFLNKIGLRRSLRISIIFDGIFYTCFFMVDKNPALFLSLSLVALFFARMLFWLPFHTDFAKFTSKADRGKEVSLMWATRSFLSVVMPIAAGFLIVKFGFNAVFIIAIALYLSAGIPFLTLPRTKERFSWGVIETFKRFFSRKNRKLVLANMANGAENCVGIIIWPIFIWQLLEGDYLKVGILSSLIIFIAITLQLVVGKYTDLFDKRKMLRYGTIFCAIGWIIKIFVLTSFHIFIAGAYHSFARIFKNTPFDTLNYEIMADRGHMVDEYTVLKEIAIQLGRVLMLIFAIVVALNFGLNWTFIVAAVASLLINFM